MGEIEQKVGIDSFVVMERFDPDLVKPQPGGDDDGNDEDRDANEFLRPGFDDFVCVDLRHKP
jgi:hypothetical protein